MKKYRSKNWVYYLALLILLYLIPLYAMTLPGYSGRYRNPADMPNLMLWISYGVLGPFTVYLHGHRTKRFSLPMVMEIVGAVLPLLFWPHEVTAWIFRGCVLVILIQAIIPAVSVLKLRCKFHYAAEDLKKDWPLLSLLWFWSVAMVLAVKLLLVGGGSFLPLAVVICMIPYTVGMIVISGTAKQALSAAGVAFSVLLLTVSVLLATEIFSGECWLIYFAFIALNWCFFYAVQYFRFRSENTP